MDDWSLSDKLLSAIIGFIVVYGGTELANHCIQSGRIEAGLIAEINDGASQAKDVADSAKYFMDNFVVQGQKISIGADYYRRDVAYYKAYIRDLPSYLSEDQLAKVIRYYGALNEFDNVADTFFARASYFESTEEPLTIYQVQMLDRTQERLAALRNVIYSNYTDLDDLPNDYSARVTPKQTIQK